MKEIKLESVLGTFPSILTSSLTAEQACIRIPFLWCTLHPPSKPHCSQGLTVDACRCQRWHSASVPKEMWYVWACAPADVKARVYCRRFSSSTCKGRIDSNSSAYAPAPTADPKPGERYCWPPVTSHFAENIAAKSVEKNTEVNPASHLSAEMDTGSSNFQSAHSQH